MELQLNHLTKIYGEKLALDNFTYTFHEGIYGILGANGAGKSTLMHLITDNVSRTSVRRQIPGNPGLYAPAAGALREHDL